jgi:hypothetical protein
MLNDAIMDLSGDTILVPVPGNLAEALGKQHARGLRVSKGIPPGPRLRQQDSRGFSARGRLAGK